jgi:hypothetical protein
MYEIRVYRISNRNAGSQSRKIRTATIKKPGRWFGIFAWCRLWFTLRKSVQRKEEQYRGIAADCSPRVINARFRY